MHQPLPFWGLDFLFTPRQWEALSTGQWRDWDNELQGGRNLGWGWEMGPEVQSSQS